MNQKEIDVQMMLAAGCHLGTKNCDFQMERYVFGRNQEGIHVFNLEKTWNKLQLAARIIVAIEDPQDVMVATARPYAQRAVLKFAHYTGTKYQAGRHTPGTFTNQIQKYYEEPRLLLLCDPRTDHQPIKEASYVNIPTIAFCDTDSPVKYVDIAIPANNKGKHAIGVLYFILARMVLQMRGTLPSNEKWDVVVDLFFFREPEDIKEEEADGAIQPQIPGAEAWVADAPVAAHGGTYAAAGEGWEDAGGAPFVDTSGGWSAAQPTEGGWGDTAPPPGPPVAARDDWGSAPPPGQPAAARDDWGSAPPPGPPAAARDDWGSAPPPPAGSRPPADDWSSEPPPRP